MATGSVRPVRNINLKSGRFTYRSRHESSEDVVIKLDHSREPADNVREVLRNVVPQHGVASSRKTAYLNSFVKLIKHVGYDQSLGVSILDIVTCLQIGLLNEAKQVRTASLRVLRYLLPYEETLDTLLNLHFDYLIARCLDVSLDNEIERIHAVKLMRQIIKTSPFKFPSSLLYALVAIGNDGASERDRMVRVCLETICELALSNTDLVAKCGAIQTLIWNILDCHQYPRLNEALTATIIFMLNHPRTRHYIRPQVDLERLLAPFTDSHFRYSLEDGRSEERDSRFIASKMAVITVMRSWPGLIRLCHPDGSGMQSLIGILYLPYVEIRKYILEVISDLFRLTLPVWTDDFATAFSSVDPCELKDSWKLPEGFVVEEGREILPHISQTRPNLIENHLALLLSAWFTAGLCERLSCRSYKLSDSWGMSAYSRAHQAVTCLTRFHKMMKRGRKPCTVFLDQLLQHAGKMLEVTSKHWHLRREKLSEYYFKKIPSDDMTNQAIRDSQVNTTKANSEWDWSIIAAILKWPDEKLKKLEDQNHLRFIKRLVYYFKPENNLFSKTDLDPTRRKICIAGCHFVDFLLSSTSDEADKMITELLSDIAENLKELIRFNVPVDENATFGSKRMHDKVCRYYFLFIGQFLSHQERLWLSRKNGHHSDVSVVCVFLELMSSSTSLLYVKLVISCLNYSLDGSTRAVLSKALTATQDVCRLYATRLLRVLMRAGTPGFSHWGVELLVTQLYDPEKSVSMSAIRILDEACDNEDNLKNLIKLRPSLLHLGEKGDMLLCRFVSTINGFRSLNNANFIPSQLHKWQQTMNERYVDIVEEMLNEALMSFEKTYSGSCPRRSILKGPKKDVYLPVHLYGQLTMHDEGFQLLHGQECIKEYFSCIQNQNLLNNSDIRKLKTALWAVGHIGLSVDGLVWLEQEHVVPEMIRLAEECSVFSVRGTSFFVLGLIASTRRGTDILCELGWESRCHTRKEVFPVLDEDGWIQGPMEEALLLSDRMAAASIHGEGNRLSPGSMGLSLIQEESLLRSGSSSSKPSSQSTLRASMSSIQSAREPLMKHSITPAHSYHHVPPYTSPPNLTVPSFVRSQTLTDDTEDFRSFRHSMHSRTRSEKAITRKTSDFRPRALTGDKTTLPPAPPVSVVKADSVPVNIDSIKLVVDRAGTDSGLDRRASRDSITLVASPVVKLRTSSDEDSAIISDNYDPQAESRNRVINLDTAKNPGKASSEPAIEEATHSVEDNVGATLRNHQSSHYWASNESSPKDKSGNGDVVSFKVGELYTPASNQSSGSDSSNPSKSRGGSFYTTDSSGVGSCDSNTVLVTSSAIANALSPIASSASLSTLTTNVSSSNLLQGTEQTKEPVHHSALQRSLFRLTRIPSAKRRSASPALGITANGGQSFTSQRDAIGYAALRTIKRQRTYSAETEGDSVSHLEAPMLHRTTSQDSELSVDSNVWLSMRRNVSSVSLQDQDLPSSPVSLNRAAFKPLSPSNRFVGITLPIDIKMIFEVVEGEDRRTSHALPPTVNLESDNFVPVAKPTDSNVDFNLLTVPPLKKETSFEHTADICLLCNRYRRKAVARAERSVNQMCAENVIDSDGALLSATKSDINRSRGGSMNEHCSSVTPGSQTSISSGQDIGNKRLTEDSEEGRQLIRLEVMRLIVNLGSSVGLKASETALLSLKQRFPACFQDVCFYSEVCHLLSLYSYRLVARRFIQELFDELNINGLLETPCELLGIDLEVSQHMTPIRQNSLDEFSDFSTS
ncbi:unnamed protein product [Candidula unifasciata]|uniref:Rapamycin-insensitive companion of mTOR n=1 Tax=Candidula unifasciata TaxID=100452 RepID=A0A8S3Z135_9EUPU|nr:unnamed protein product [Candidula unifasciata]